MNILITGGTGLVGSRLSQLLSEQGHQVSHLSRKENLKAQFPAYRWNIDKMEIDDRAITNADAIIHLAGTGIADARWSEARKKDIVDSRVKSTQLIAEAIQLTGHKPKAFISASAVGYYGNAGNQLCTEDMPSTEQSFLAETCRLWEGSTQAISALGIRVAIARVGIVLSTQGGALAKMLPTYSIGVGGHFGGVWTSWIHIDDICGIFMHLLQNKNLSGPFNGVAPNPVTSLDLAKGIRDAKGTFAFLAPAPTFVLKLAMGEMAEVVLQSCKASSDKITKAGYVFKFPALVPAIKDLLGK